MPAQAACATLGLMASTDFNLLKLVAQAAGGRVVRTPFLALDTLDRRPLQNAEIKFLISGGFATPQRAMLTLYPVHIPSVTDPVEVLELSGEFPPVWDPVDVLIALKSEGIDPDLTGDVRFERGSYLVAVTGKAKEALEKLTQLGSLELSVEKAELNASARVKTREVVVPSMRVDAVGAKGFGVSRSYFQGGLENGKVRLNGQVAKSSSEIREGDTLSAEGLGRLEFKRVVNETRRGNFKLELEIHK